VSTDSLDTMFRAFADRTRLRLLNLLRGGEVCVGDIVAVLDVPQPTVSRHLASLRRSGLVAVERRGLWRIYSLAPPASDFHARLLDCLSCCLAEAPELRRDADRLAALRARGGCCADPTPEPAPCCAEEIAP